MNLPKLLAAALLISVPAFAQDEPNRYADFNKQIQERLKERGFYNGPVNGEIGPNTQAAIAQFQLSVPLPASGMVDEATVAALGMDAHLMQPGAIAGNSEQAGAGAGAEERTLSGSCDQLVGPQREACVQKGGTVEASAR